MMGGDIEAIVSGIEAVKDATVAAITSLASATSYQLISREQHAGIGSGPCAPEEIEKPAGDVMSGVSAAMGAMSGSCGKMSSMEGSMFTGSTSFNNSVGSPWTELSKLQKAVAAAEAYAGGAAPFNYVGDKAGMLGMLNMVMTAAVDAKWAIIYYHDYTQRGFDTMFNGNKASITFTNGLNGKQTTGNVQQQFDENVHIPEPSIDPY